jgi:vanillate O-demethylase ferredoxin subunit
MPSENTTAPDAFTLVLARSQRELLVGAGESMVDVLHLAGVAVETLCEQGVCGTCVTRWLDGEPEHHDACLGEHERSTHLAVCCARSRRERLTLDL